MNVCRYVLYRTVNYVFEHVMFFSKVVVHEPLKILMKEKITKIARKIRKLKKISYHKRYEQNT